MTGRLWRGSLLGVTEQAVRALSALLLTPLLVSKLGGENFGLWVLLTGLVSQFVLLDPGLQTLLPGLLVTADENRRRALASTAQLTFAAIALGMLLLTGLVWWAMPWLVHEPTKLATARVVALLLGVATAAGMAVRVLTLGLASALRQDVIARVSIGRVLVCSGLVAWWLLREQGGVTCVAVIQSAGAVAEALLLAWHGRTWLASIRPCWASREMASELLRCSGWAYLISTCDRLRSGLDVFVIGALRGSAASADYSLAQRPASMGFDAVYAGVSTQLLPFFGRLKETGDRARLAEVFLCVLRLSTRITFTAGLLLLALGPAFLRLWVPAHAAAALPVLLCLALPFALQTAQAPAVHLLYTLNKHRALARVQVLALLLNLGLSVLLAWRLGIVGAALGTAIEIALLHGLVMPWLLAREAGIMSATFIQRGQLAPLLSTVVLMAPLGALAWWLLESHATWPVFVSLAAGLGITAVLGLWFTGGRADWQRLKALV